MFTLTIGKLASSGNWSILDQGKINSQSVQIDTLQKADYDSYTNEVSYACVIDSVLGVVAQRDFTFAAPKGYRLKVTTKPVTITVGGTFNPDVVITGFDYKDTAETVLEGSATVKVYDAGGHEVVNVSAAAAGEYAVKVSGFTSDKYYIDFVASTLTIKKIPLTVTVTNAEMDYRGSAPSYEVTYNGFEEGDDDGDLGGSLSFAVNGDGEAVADVTTADAGEYNITATGLTSDKYEITYISGTLAIKKVALTIKVEDKTVTDAYMPISYTLNYIGFVGSESSDVLTGAPVYTVYDGEEVINPQEALPGAYDVEVSGLTAKNYNITFENGELTIQKSWLLITAKDKSMTYGGVAPEYGVVMTGFVGDDNETAIGDGSAAYDITDGDTQPVADVTIADAGTYTITPKGFTSDDYSIHYATGNLTIAKAALTIKAVDQVYEEGNQSMEFTVDYTGFQAGDTAAIEGVFGGALVITIKDGSGDTVEPTEAGPGTYTIIPSGLTAKNYNITFENGELEITQAT